MAQKRFFIGFNGILLALYLDICLLVTIRTVDSSGHFLSSTDKWETITYVSLVYGLILFLESILYLILKHHRKKQGILSQV